VLNQRTLLEQLENTPAFQEPEAPLSLTQACQFNNLCYTYAIQSISGMRNISIPLLAETDLAIVRQSGVKEHLFEREDSLISNV